MSTKTLYPNVPAAVGAWVAAEMSAAIARPNEMLGADTGRHSGPFDGVAFEDHLTGMLSDLLCYCVPDGPVDRPCYLVVLENENDDPDRETQWCLQGRVYIEGA